MGITHIDTSNVYGMGQSEDAIVRFLRSRPGTRAQVHIATKAAIARDADGNRVFGNSAAHLEAELDKSLKRMGIERVGPEGYCWQPYLSADSTGPRSASRNV